MMVVEFLMELVPRRGRFESSKPNKKGNGGYHEEDEEGHSYYGNSSSSDDGNRKPQNEKWRPNSPKEKRGKLRCYFCKGPHMKKDCPKVSSVSAIKRNDEPEEKRNCREELMFVDINIAGQKRSALVDTGASDLFISKKVVGNLVSQLRNQIGRS
ncbi:hypothetical protein Golob_005275 [Gossypium lobatum]|uniref:Uncharacterized protein n=1 Tax=Gossypium lobatum TaxID=34289 RepID=A0A7J8MSS2_9ROSI|nr:hypothetical protein [Gossypium lobatum]